MMRVKKKKKAKNAIQWECVHAEGHLLFPGSNHIETLAIFDRIDSLIFSVIVANIIYTLNLLY